MNELVSVLEIKAVEQLENEQLQKCLRMCCMYVCRVMKECESCGYRSCMVCAHVCVPLVTRSEPVTAPRAVEWALPQKILK